MSVRPLAFISYARSDADCIGPLSKTLELAGFRVWTDELLKAGSRYQTEIEDVITAADVVVVIWSGASVQSDFVRAEATLGLSLGKLMPVAIENVLPPIPFNILHYAGCGRNDFSMLGEMLSVRLNEVGFPKKSPIIGDVVTKSFSGFGVRLRLNDSKSFLEFRTGLGREKILIDNRVVVSRWNFASYGLIMPVLIESWTEVLVVRVQFGSLIGRFKNFQVLHNGVTLASDSI
ncbi:MAG: toll/interleukin-1 receptor domain-containing protein [Pseudomonadota bacterium]